MVSVGYVDGEMKVALIQSTAELSRGGIRDSLIGVELVDEASVCAESSGSERRSAVEATGQVYYPVTWLPPGHYPGACGGLVTTAQQRVFWALGTKLRPQGRARHREQ